MAAKKLLKGNYMTLVESKVVDIIEAKILELYILNLIMMLLKHMT